MSLASELRRAAPYAILLAVALAAVLVVGVNLSNASPSEARPFGWPGPSKLTNGVAMVRGPLLLAGTLPALLLGVATLRERDPRKDSGSALVPALGVDMGLLVAAVLVATSVGAMASFRAPPQAFLAFFVAHSLLALMTYAIAFGCAAVARGYAMPVAGGVWLAFHAIYEDATHWAVFRDAGYARLAAGDFPTWFFVAQAFSPLSAYRGVLILWERGFMDYVEGATLGKAALPAWVNPATFILLGGLLFVVVPMSLGFATWSWRARMAKDPLVAVRPAQRLS